jgi:pimeloyl-ACP methyl ester carboxylesterase
VSLPGVQDTWAVLLPKVATLRGMRPEVTLTGELPRIHQPALVIWGERDMQAPEEGERATRLMPHARFVTLPGIGHFPFLEDPVRCAELILGFMAETSEWNADARHTA